MNQEWREGYKVQTSNTGRYVSDPVLSHVVVVSVSGAYNDYQVHINYFHVIGLTFFCVILSMFM